MALPFEVEILEICQISPPPSSVPTTSLPLTFFDLSWLDFPPIKSLYYYQLHQPKDYLLNTILPNIKHSLSLTLQHFFPLAGQLTWPKDSTTPAFLYTEGDSVTFTVAECNYDFEHLSGSQLKNAEELYPLAPSFELSDDKRVPLLAVQVTLFPDKGVCIGTIFNHVAADGRSIHHFIRSWAAFCKSQGVDTDITSVVMEPLPFHDRAMVNDKNGIEKIKLKDLEAMNITRETYHISKAPVVPINKVRGTFIMSSSDINKLKQWVSNRVEKEKQTHYLSTFVIICSYIWVCAVKARPKNVGDQKEHFLISADCRGRLDPPLPLTYFGNCIGGFFVKCDTSELIGENGIAIAAELIGKSIVNLDDELWGIMQKGLSFYKTMPWGKVVAVSGSHKFAPYETDFGWGKVKKKEVSSIDAGGAISLTDGPNGNGSVEISLVRDATDMEAFASLFTNTLHSLTS
ncbi:hypothetical protein ACHQM5_004362 [Ranunculus cassubicifolius]